MPQKNSKREPGGRRTVGEIAANFRTSRPAISKHLRLMRAAGLVATERHGTARICGLNARPLRTVGDWLRDYEAFWSETVHDLKNYVERGIDESGASESARASHRGWPQVLAWLQAYVGA